MKDMEDAKLGESSMTWSKHKGPGNTSGYS